MRGGGLTADWRVDEEVDHNGQSGYASCYSPSVERVKKEPSAFGPHGFFAWMAYCYPGAMSDGVEPKVDGAVSPVNQCLQKEKIEVRSGPGIGCRQDEVARHGDNQRGNETDQHTTAQVSQFLENEMNCAKNKKNDDPHSEPNWVKDPDEELEKIAFVQWAGLADQSVVDWPVGRWWRWRSLWMCPIFSPSRQSVTEMRDRSLTKPDTVDAILVQGILKVTGDISEFVHNMTQDTKWS